ncbi:MAG TPA: MarR family transcriptional regulator [Pseudonocardiaceae bacterium]|jgi:DNA-binding MarR family transcriptional regulator|nr:MarR family transcriptional regulator [Pseudonocardiaceae bacterium]
MDEVRWLTGPEQEVWRRYLAATRLLETEIDRQLQRDAGLPATYFEILVALSEAPDRTMRMSELAEFARFSRSRLSHAVARMESAGWVVRTECPSDKRGAFAVLTEAGFAVLSGVAPGHVELVRSMLFDVLTPEQVDQLGEICSAINEAAKN